MMRLFYTPATSSLFPHIVLNEAGLTFEKTKVDEHTKLMETGEDYRTINPLGFVPALRLDDGTVLTEGTAIVQYIADQVPTKERNSDPMSMAPLDIHHWLLSPLTKRPPQR
jgi:glutathione S-transferase